MPLHPCIHTYICIHIDILHTHATPHPPPPPPPRHPALQSNFSLLKNSTHRFRGLLEWWWFFFIHDSMNYKPSQQNCVALQAECAALSLKKTLVFFKSTALEKDSLFRGSTARSAPAASKVRYCPYEINSGVPKCCTVPEQTRKHSGGVITAPLEKRGFLGTVPHFEFHCPFFETSGRMHLPQIGFFGTHTALLAP